mgnify:CR=1 FL=1
MSSAFTVAFIVGGDYDHQKVLTITFLLAIGEVSNLIQMIRILLTTFFPLTAEIRDHLQKHPNKLQYCADASNNFKIMRLPGRKDLHEKIIKFNGDHKTLENDGDVLKIQY